jgi:aspartate aminotransferase
VTLKVTALLTHVGAWAPRPVQTATARFLRERDTLAAWQRDVTARVRERLDALHEIMQTLRAEGFPVGAVEPQGAIYMSVRFDLRGRRSADGRGLDGNEAVRSWLLREAAFAVVPFAAFGVAPAEEDGWFRASVGAVSRQDVRDALPRLRRALASLRPA